MFLSITYISTYSNKNYCYYKLIDSAFCTELKVSEDELSCGKNWVFAVLDFYKNNRGVELYKTYGEIIYYLYMSYIGGTYYIEKSMELFMKANIPYYNEQLSFFKLENEEQVISDALEYFKKLTLLG